MGPQFVQSLAARGCFLDPEAAAHIAAQPDPDGYLQRVLAAFLELPFRLTLPQLLSAESLSSPVMPVPPVATRPEAVLVRPTVLAARPDAVVDAREHDAEVEVLIDATSEGAPLGEISDFVRYFNDRYDTLGRLLRKRREVAHAVPIARAAQGGKGVAFIGLVEEVAKSNKSGHRFVELQDTSGSATVLVRADRPDLVALADSLLTDEVIGIVANPSRDQALLVAESIIRPDLPMRADQRAPMEVPLHAAFLGDVHLGSKTFLGDAFRRLVHWLHGDDGTQQERALARSIKYLVFPGDIVDGVGVYPGQEDSLAIPDILAQYRQLALELESLPRHLHLVLLPGNHDASRPTEPQPAFDKEIRGYFDGLDCTFVSNPSTFSLHGRRVLSYHGFSMIDFATHVPNLSLERPTEIMRQMLQCRHVAPAYGAKTPVSPDARDRLLINLEPDIFATGHVHVAGLDRYKGVSLVNGGTWQSQTSYQKMHNLTPTPAVLPTINLSSLNATKVDFSIG